MSEPRLFQIAADPDGETRTETLMGREFSVFPAVLVRAQVLNNNLGATYLPAEEIEASVDAWNGIPVVIRHPEDLRSARDPEVLNDTGVGYLFHSRFEDESLKADVFVDLERAGSVEDAGTVVNRVASGAVGEVSTGFSLNIERSPGEHEGNRYDVVMRDIRPDHLALLVEETGACSVSDGCGLGVNAAADKSWIGTLRDHARALLQGVGLLPFADNESDEDLREALGLALREKFGGSDVWIWIAATYSDEGLVVYEREARAGDAGLFRVSFDLSEGGEITLGEPEEVRRVTTFEPVTNTGDSHQEETMRDEMIAQLAEAGTPREALEALNDCQLKALLEAGTNSEANGADPAANATPDDKDATIADLTARLEALEGAAAPAIAEVERERTELIAALASNERCAFDETELHPMSTAHLRKLSQSLQIRNYAGQGGPRAHQQASEEYAPIRPYYVTED